MKVNNKVIVVTGGGNGVGRELTLQLLKRGSKVAAIDINMKSLKETQVLSNHNDHLSIHQVDITDQSSVYSLVEEVIRIHGRVDGIVNNAGIIQPFTNLVNLSDEVIDRVMNVNFYGTLNMVRAFLPELMKRPQAHILNISSMGGFFPVPGQSIYGASKAAVKLMSEGLAVELRDTNVSVSLVIPGGIATDIKKNSNIKSNNQHQDEKASKMLLSPQKVVTLAIKAVEQEQTVTYIGKDSKVMNLLYKISPRLSAKLITKVLSANEH